MADPADMLTPADPRNSADRLAFALALRSLGDD
jgi:hypothetical protein